MKDFKLLIRNVGFWFVVYSILTTATIVIMAITWNKHECPKPTNETAHKVEILELKLKKYEDIISNDSVIIWKSDRKHRDSIRAIRFNEYMQ